MSYWHSKIPAVDRGNRPFWNANYYIYYGKVPICRVYFFTKNDITIAFGKWLVNMDFGDKYFSTEERMSFIFRNLKGTNKIDSLEQRAGVFVVKCKLTNAMFASIKMEREI